MSDRVELSTPALQSKGFYRAPRLRGILGRDWKVAIPFVLPMALIMIGLILWPFIDAILLSTTALNFLTGETVNVGLRNFARLPSNSDYLQAMGNTIRFTLWSLAVKFVAGMTIALILNSRLPLRRLLSAIVLLPWIVPEIVTALAWKSIYDPIFGGLNPILLAAGVISEPLGWLSDAQLAMPSVIAVNVWKGIPFYILLLLAGLKTIDPEQLEAAKVDGANILQRFRHITLPGLRYVILVVLLLSFISTFNQFGLVFLMTRGGPGGATKLYSILAYERAFGALQYGPGSAIAFSVAPLMAVLIWFLAKFMRPEGLRNRPDGKPGIGDGFSGLAGRAMGRVLDLIFLPFELLFQAVESLARVFRRLLNKSAHQSLLKAGASRRVGLLLRLLLLIPFMIFVLFPFYWVIVTSFKTTSQISRRASIFWPDPATLDQVKSLVTATPFPTWFTNSMVVAAASTAISVSVAALAAYALARLKFRGAGVLTAFLMITYLLPGTLIFIPLYQTLTNLGLINTYGALIATYPTFLVPFATWVMLGFFRSIPAELEEAAMIDGASRLYAFWRIVLPLAAPALLAVTLFAFSNAWNEFLFAFVFITSESLRTLPIGLQSMVIGDILPWGQLMAAALLTAIPIAVLYVFAQRFLVEGLTVGGVKG
jgi:multiple sugar transport system permease protein